MKTTVKAFLGQKDSVTGKRKPQDTPEVFESDKIGSYIVLVLNNTVDLETGELVDGGVTAFAGDKEVLLQIKTGFTYKKG